MSHLNLHRLGSVQIRFCSHEKLAHEINVNTKFSLLLHAVYISHFGTGTTVTQVIVKLEAS